MAKALTDVITDINAILATVSGIKKVFTNMPNVAPSGTADLPCCIPVLDRTSWKAQTIGFLRKRHGLKYLLLISTRGKDLSSTDAQAKAFADSVPEALFPYVQLNDPNNIAHIDENTELVMTYQDINYSGTEYVGFVIEIPVIIKKVIPQQP